MLGIFEMIIHTAGNKIRHIKGWYAPGIITGRIIGIFSIYSIITYSRIAAIQWTDVLLGSICMVAVMGCLQALVQKAAGSSLPKMIAQRDFGDCI